MLVCGQDLEQVLVAGAAAGSPLQLSSLPRMANRTSAALKNLRERRRDLWLRASNDDMQPTQ